MSADAVTASSPSPATCAGPGTRTSLDLYLEHPPGSVLEAGALVDVACGIYPCFYRRDGDRLQVSSSVASLIRASGSFRPNPWFRPPFLEPAPAPQGLRGLLRRLRGQPRATPGPSWYDTRESMDLRIFRLRAGERVTPNDSRIVVSPTPELRDSAELIERSAQHFQDFITRIEERFPERHHVVLVGGKDSQMMLLAQRKNPERWHVFSAEPNYPLVRQWLEWNDISFGRLIRHDNENDETREEWERKIIASDLYSDPHHIRFLPSLARLGRQFDQSFVVWSGTAADAIFARHPSFHGQGRDEWFRRHMTQVACWQGSAHQTLSNFLGVPLLSPYHSPELWNEVLFRHDPETMRGDLRTDLGHCLFGREVRWLSQNPSPPPYASVHQGDPRAMYARYVSCGKTQGTPHRDDE